MDYKKKKYPFLNKKGFTMIEIIMALPLILLITGMIVSITFLMFSMQKTTNEHLEVNINNSNIVQAITLDIINDSNLEVINDKEFILNNNLYSFKNQEVIRFSEGNKKYKLAEGNFTFNTQGDRLRVQNKETRLDVTLLLNGSYIKKEGE